MPDFKDLDSMKSWLQQKINSALVNEVAETVKEVEQEKIEETVYARPVSFYQRRGADGGGLGDINNMTSSLVNSGILEVRNDTKVNPLLRPDGSYYNNAFPSSYGLGEIVEFGNSHGVIHNPARPFIKATVVELQNSDKLATSLKKALKRQGVKTD